MINLFTLSVYAAFTFFFFINKNLIVAGLILVLFYFLSHFLKPLNERKNLILVIFLTHFTLISLNKIPYFHFVSWPLDFYLISIFGFVFIKKFLKEKILPLNWSFKFSKKEILSVFVINIPSVAVLLWYYSNNKDVAKQWPVLDVPAWILPILVLMIAIINGLREEIFYRGLLQSYSEKKYPPWFVVFFQALFFGTLHFSNAFPQGYLGVGLTALWGGAIAIQYSIFKSITLAWLTHSMADAIMFGIILYFR